MIGLYKIAIRIAIVYFIFSFLYITLSDKILLAVMDDPHSLTVFQTYKGVAFVLLTSLLLLLIINREVSKQKKYDIELRNALEKVERSDRLKTSFLNNISHEIRTPMNCLLGFSELLVDRDISEEDRSVYLKIMKNNGDQLLRIIDDILDISKIEVGIIDFKKIEFSLNELLEEMLVFIENLLEKRGNILDVKVVNNSEIKIDIIWGDKERLIRILQNLLTNSVKFTQEGQIEIIYFINTENFLEFHIKDTGIGIGEDKIERIFEPFVQEEDTISRYYGGTGLGLSISKAFVEIMGGKIGVVSRKGGGSDFFFTIPYLLE